MMKEVNITRRSHAIRFLVLLLVLTVIIFFSPFLLIESKADDLDNQISLKEVQFQSLQWEFRYIQERMNTLQTLGEKLQSEIQILRKQKAEKVEPKK